MPEDYRVVPGVLRGAATQLQEAANCWWHAHNQLAATPDIGTAVGLLGRLAGVHDAYAAARQAALDGLTTGTQRVGDSAQTLGDVATHYENVEFAEYERMGYVDFRMAPP